MSMKYSGTIRRRLPRRPVSPSRASAESLGQLIRSLRLMDGRRLEELAPQAGLTVAEWEAIEAGLLPVVWEQILVFAMVFRLGRSWMSPLRKLCERAWPRN